MRSHNYVWTCRFIVKLSSLETVVGPLSELIFYFSLITANVSPHLDVMTQNKLMLIRIFLYITFLYLIQTYNHFIYVFVEKFSIREIDDRRILTFENFAVKESLVFWLQSSIFYHHFISNLSEQYNIKYTFLKHY